MKNPADTDFLSPHPIGWFRIFFVLRGQKTGFFLQFHDFLDIGTDLGQNVL